MPNYKVMHSCAHSRHLQKPSGSQSHGKRPATVTPQKELILGAVDLSFSKSFFPLSYFKNISCKCLSFCILGPPVISTLWVFLLPAILACLAHLLSLHLHTALVYNWTIFLGVHIKVMELSHTRAMHNQNNWGHIYILHQHHCSISILLPLSVLPQHAVQSIMPAAGLRAITELVAPKHRGSA